MSTPPKPKGSSQRPPGGDYPPYHIVDETSGLYLVATLGPYVLVLVQRSLGNTGVRAFLRANERLAAEHAKVGHFVILYAQSEMPGPEEREALAALLKRFREVIGAAAIVHEGSGVRATLTRSLVSLVHLASGASHPARVFSQVGEASAWLESQLPMSVKFAAADLRLAVRELRRSLG